MSRNSEAGKFLEYSLEVPGGGTPLYQVYRYAQTQRVWLLSRFGLKTGIDFEHFGLKLGMVIRGNVHESL